MCQKQQSQEITHSRRVNNFGFESSSSWFQCLTTYLCNYYSTVTKATFRYRIIPLFCFQPKLIYMSFRFDRIIDPCIHEPGTGTCCEINRKLMYKINIGNYISKINKMIKNIVPWKKKEWLSRKDIFHWIKQTLVVIIYNSYYYIRASQVAQW